MYSIKPIIDPNTAIQGQLAHTMYTITGGVAPQQTGGATINLATVTAQIANVQKKTAGASPAAVRHCAEIAERQAKLLATLAELHHKLHSMQTILNNPAATAAAPAAPTGKSAAKSAAATASKTAKPAAATPKPVGEPFFVQQELHRQRFSVPAKQLTAAQLGGDIVINANPRRQMPYALRVLKSLWQDRVELRVSTFQHSSFVGALPEAAVAFQTILAYTRPLSAGIEAVPVLPVTLIWKECAQPELICDAAALEPIRGESQIIRYLYRCGPAELQWPEYRVADWFRVDAVLDAVHELMAEQLHQQAGQRRRLWAKLAELLGEEREFYGGDLITAADVAVASAARQLAYVAKTDVVADNLVAMANRVYELSEHLPKGQK